MNQTPTKAKSCAVRDNLTLATPLLIGSAAYAFSEFADRIFLGHYGETALAATLPASMIAGSVNAFLIGVIAYSRNFITRYLGGNRPDLALSAFRHSLRLAVLALPVLAAVAWPGCMIIDAFGHDETLRAAEKTYFVSYLFVGAFSLFSSVLGGWFAAHGRTGLVGIATAIGCAANVALDPLLIFACDLGILGSGIATVAGFATTALILSVSCMRSISGYVPPPDDDVSYAQLLRQGLPNGTATLLGSCGLTFFMLSLGRYGSEVLAATNALFAFHGFIFYLVSAFASAGNITIGWAIGKQDRNDVKRHYRAAMTLSIGAVSLVYLAAIPLSSQVLAIFGIRANPIPVGLGATVLMTGFFIRDIADAVQVVCTNALKASGDTRGIMMSRLIASVLVWIPATAILLRSESPIPLLLTMPASYGLLALLLRLKWAKSLPAKPQPNA